MNSSGNTYDIAGIYKKYSPALYGVLKSIIADSAKADELLAGLFHNLADDLANYKHRDNLLLWLINLTREKAIATLILGNENTDAAAVNSYVNKLPSLQRTIFALVFFKGLRLNEVAEILNLPVEKIESVYNGLPNFTPHLFPNVKRTSSPVPDILQAMVKNLVPENDVERLHALNKYELLYTPPEETFDKVTQMSARVFNTPLAFLSLVDKDTVFYKSQVGDFGRVQVNREHSLCSLTILSKEPLIIEDTSLGECFLENPFINVDGGIKFYAGVPLITKDGFVIGALCVVDTERRSFSHKETLLLTEFAAIAMREIELRHENFQKILLQEQVDKLNKESLSPQE